MEQHWPKAKGSFSCLTACIVTSTTTGARFNVAQINLQDETGAEPLINSSNRFQRKLLAPVRLPPGRFRLATRP
jgi:hypothetical protein